LKNFKPMLASPADLNALRFPLLASPKLDGVRAIVLNGVVMSRSLKPIPNLVVQDMFKRFEHYDGELIVGDPYAKNCYNETVSGVMRVSGRPNVKFYVFDSVGQPNEPYGVRRPMCSVFHNLVEVPQIPVKSVEEILELEENYLAKGFEGLILRHPEAPYKYGRSTTKEGYLLKLKRFTDSEFEVVGFEERLHNGNEAKLDELGRMKRSSHKENKSGLGDLGALVLQGDGFTFSCGTGFDDATRKYLWAIRSTLIGRMAKIKHFEVGAKIAPRHPVFLGFRDSLDMS